MDKIKELKIDKKKYLDIAIIFACIIAITLVGTFALKLWTSTNNTELTFRIGEYSTEGITCKSGEDVTISNIGPVFDYEKDGEVITFNVVTASSNTTPLNVSFNISTITDNLKETSFKYALMSSTDKTNYTEILKGDFSNISSGSSITLIEDKVVTATTYYKLIIYIDGNMENPTSMQNGSLTGNVEMCIEGGDIVIDSFKVDGVETTKFPLSSGYDINTTCSDATIAFDYKSQSYEISNISKSKVKCGFNYTTKTNKTYLNDYIKSLAGTTQGNGQLVNEQIDVYGNVDSPITSITNYSQYKATSSSATSGTTISDYSVTNSSGSDPATITFNSSTLDSTYYYMFKYNINEDGEYSVNINVPSYTAIGCSGCGIRGSYVEDVSFYINSTEAETIAITATGSSKKNLGNLSSGDTIKVIYKLNYVNNTIITVPSPSGGSEVMSNKTSSRSSDVLPMAVSGTPTGTPNSFNVKFYKTTEGVAGTESTCYRYE